MLLGYAQKVRASIQDVTRAIKSAGIPRQIIQQPFDHDPGHYWRLCNLRGADPQAADLCDYALDMQYMELQPELLRHLTPILLIAWRKDLFQNHASRYGGFVEQFWTALLKGNALCNIYSAEEKLAFAAFIRNSILDRLDSEEHLHFVGMGVSPYSWISALTSYGVVFSDVMSLWSEWWQMKTSGHAVAAFQYVSVLMYENDKNPVFDPWTKDKGGGPPSLWEFGGYVYDVGWTKQNLEFLKDTLSADYFKEKLCLALNRIENPTSRKIASRIVGDFDGQRTRLELRIEQLPDLLTDASRLDGFTI